MLFLLLPLSCEPLWMKQGFLFFERLWLKSSKGFILFHSTPAMRENCRNDNEDDTSSILNNSFVWGYGIYEKMGSD